MKRNTSIIVIAILIILAITLISIFKPKRTVEEIQKEIELKSIEAKNNTLELEKQQIIRNENLKTQSEIQRLKPVDVQVEEIRAKKTNDAIGTVGAVAITAGAGYMILKLLK